MFVSKFAPRGAPNREELEQLARAGATLREIGTALDRSIATVRYWLDRWEIPRADSRRRRDYDPADAPKNALRTCGKHGLTTFVLEGRGSYRCKKCRLEQVSAWRRRAKAILVAEAGGRCAACGYDRCQAALQFHHLDPGAKVFALSARGVTRGLAKARMEARKCVLLCANCHAEIEAGFRELDAA
jgi:Homeodomain-like domain